MLSKKTHDIMDTQNKSWVMDTAPKGYITKDSIMLPFEALETWLSGYIVTDRLLDKGKQIKKKSIWRRITIMQSKDETA